MLEPPCGSSGLIPLGFMNQTICAVWIGDKSRFLSLCYRLAAPECCAAARLTLAAPKKHRQINLFFTIAGAVFYCLECFGNWASRAPVSLAECRACQATQQARLGRGRIRVAADTRTEAPAASRGDRSRPTWPNTRAGHAAENPLRRRTGLPSLRVRRCDSPLLARFCRVSPVPTMKVVGAPRGCTRCPARAGLPRPSHRPAPTPWSSSSMASLRRMR